MLFFEHTFYQVIFQINFDFAQIDQIQIHDINNCTQRGSNISKELHQNVVWPVKYLDIWILKNVHREETIIHTWDVWRQNSISQRVKMLLSCLSINIKHFVIV